MCACWKEVLWKCYGYIPVSKTVAASAYSTLFQITFMTLMHPAMFSLRNPIEGRLKDVKGIVVVHSLYSYKAFAGVQDRPKSIKLYHCTSPVLHCSLDVKVFHGE